MRVITKDYIQNAAQEAGRGIKKVELLSGAWDGPYAVASVVIDNVRPDAEVHEHAADVWHVLKGSGKFILGGKLENVKEVRAGEFTASSIRGGIEYEVTDGDVVDIPAGVPHQIDAAGSRLEMLIIKING